MVKKLLGRFAETMRNIRRGCNHINVTDLDVEDEYSADLNGLEFELAKMKEDLAADAKANPDKIKEGVRTADRIIDSYERENSKWKTIKIDETPKAKLTLHDVLKEIRLREKPDTGRELEYMCLSKAAYYALNRALDHEWSFEEKEKILLNALFDYERAGDANHEYVGRVKGGVIGENYLLAAMTAQELCRITREEKAKYEGKKKDDRYSNLKLNEREYAKQVVDFYEKQKDLLKKRSALEQLQALATNAGDKRLLEYVARHPENGNIKLKELGDIGKVINSVKSTLFKELERFEAIAVQRKDEISDDINGLQDPRLSVLALRFYLALHTYHSIAQSSEFV